MTTPSSPTGPRPFGKYLLDRELARGGMARVHLARLRGVGGFEKRLVLKEIDPSLATNPRFITLFVEEANALVAMSHPHIVPVYELGVLDGVYFLTMEHVEGATLEALVEEAELAPEEVAHVGAQLADALAYAHERFSLIHRDVTPRNVMIDVHGHARLLDFGIAARMGEAADPASIFGTPGFLSPEQARGEPLTSSSDLFSLGALLHHAATGQPAFEARAEATARLEERPALPALDGLPPTLGELIRDLLDPDPAARPKDGKAVADTLRAFLSAQRPEGVAGPLGVRAEALAKRRDEALERRAPSPRLAETASGPSRSLATSPILADLLASTPTAAEERAAEEGAGPSTVPIERVSREEPTPRTSWVALAGLTLALTGAAAWALGLARFDPPTHEATPSPVDPSPLEEFPPDAALLDAELLEAGAPGTDEPDASAEALETVPAQAEAGPAARRVEAPARAALLTVQALPWADVLVDGSVVGRTPLRAHPIPAGAREITLRCPPLGREVSRTIRVRAGEAVSLGANLQADPPSFTRP